MYFIFLIQWLPNRNYICILFHLQILKNLFFFCQAKDRQKKKQAKGIRVDAEGDASLEDLTNAEPRGTEYDPSPDLEKTKSSSKKVLDFLYVFYCRCRQILMFQTW